MLVDGFCEIVLLGSCVINERKRAMSKIFETDKYDSLMVFGQDNVTEDNGSFIITRDGDSTLEVPELKNAKPILVEGIKVYPTYDQHFYTVRCYGIVDELTAKEKDMFFQKHGIQLDPSKHALIAYDADMEEWTEDYLF